MLRPVCVTKTVMHEYFKFDSAIEFYDFCCKLLIVIVDAVKQFNMAMYCFDVQVTLNMKHVVYCFHVTLHKSYIAPSN